ncbi:MAG: hypothetical protein KAT28_05010 [Candidatus Aenigmarchaeota archaeon]|nr:hypothetical protein [Candidatus Aenigmarchaeota archaeon]
MRKKTMFGAMALMVIGLIAATGMVYAFDCEERTYPLREALNSGDYDEWKAAIDGEERTPKMAEMITEENFNIFVELHEAKKNGDFETMKTIKEELGIEGKGLRQGEGKHFRNEMHSRNKMNGCEEMQQNCCFRNRMNPEE